MKEVSIDKNRITEEFLELTRLDAESYHEREIADVLIQKLKDEGFLVEEDNAAAKIGGNAGNLFATLCGSLPGAPILFAAHMDTVSPGKGKKPILLENGRITSDGSTVLGGDDVTAIVEILEGIRAVREAGIPHRDIELVFAVAEEPYGRGSAVFDYSKIRAKDVYALDMTGPIGVAITKAPSIISFCVKVKGRAAHAGFEPEKGIHSIFYMSRAIANLKLGHIDEESTLNVGLIDGGSITNAVPAECTCQGEIRSYSHAKALEITEYVKKVFLDALKDSEAEAVFDFQVNITAYETKEESTVVRRFKEAALAIGVVPQISATFGGSDNNNFVSHGLNGVVLSCGMYCPHTTAEYTTTDDLVAGAKLVGKIITSAL